MDDRVFEGSFTGGFPSTFAVIGTDVQLFGPITYPFAPGDSKLFLSVFEKPWDDA